MRGLLAVLIVAFSFACLGEGVTGSSTITGDYTLRTINGSPLPYTISGSGATLVNGADGQTTLATINANTMTIVKAGMTAVFTK